MDIPRALAFSRYAARALAADPSLAERLAASCTQPFAWDDVQAALSAVAGEDDAPALATALRVARRRLFLHTLVRDLTGNAPLTEVCGAMTQLAEHALRTSLVLHARFSPSALASPPARTTGCARNSS